MDLRLPGWVTSILFSLRIAACSSDAATRKYSYAAEAEVACPK